MGSRPRLRPDFRPLRRGRGAVQLGPSAAAGGIILVGLAPPEIALLDRLDGWLREEDLYAAAARAGVERARAAALLELLWTHRVLVTDPVDGPDAAAGDIAEGVPDVRVGPPAPTSRRVVVDGTGPLPAAVAGLLRGGDLGRVDVGPWAADVADAELREADRRSGEQAGRPAGAGQDGGPALLVLVGRGGLDPRAGEAWRRRGIPLLPVVVDGERVVVGPLVGSDPALPCLRCLELSRIDRDAAWLDVRAAQRARDDPDGRGMSESWASLRPDVASVAAGVAAMVVHAALADDPAPAGVSGVSVEVTTSWPRLDHRRWARHPACPAHDSRPPRGVGAERGAIRVTMTR
jgi:hypothetical protein